MSGFSGGREGGFVQKGCLGSVRWELSDRG